MSLPRKFASTALITLLIAGMVASVQALPSGAAGFDIIYYSDATLTDVVGERYMGCTGGVSRTGIITPYQDSFSWQCQANPPGSGGISCTITTCDQVYDSNGNPWYWNCHTDTNYDETCFWKMCNTAGHCDGE